MPREVSDVVVRQVEGFEFAEVAVFRGCKSNELSFG